MLSVFARDWRSGSLRRRKRRGGGNRDDSWEMGLWDNGRQKWAGATAIRTRQALPQATLRLRCNYEFALGSLSRVLPPQQRLRDVGFQLGHQPDEEFGADFFERMGSRWRRRRASKCGRSKAGAIANPDEGRSMVGHYWLRAPRLAPTAEASRTEIETTKGAIVSYAEEVRSAGKFKHALIVGHWRFGVGAPVCRRCAGGEK